MNSGGQGGAVNAVAKAHGVKLAGVGSQCDFDIAQAFAPSQVGKGHDAKLFGASQRAQARVATVALNDSRKTCPRNEFDDLCVKRLAYIHRKPPVNMSL